MSKCFLSSTQLPQSLKVLGLLSLCLGFSLAFPQFDGHMFDVIFLLDSPNQYQMSKLSAESRP